MPTQVYRVTNKINGKVYFGKATCAQIRWARHFWAVRHGSAYPFHRALRKYGPDAFLLEIIATYPMNSEACLHEIQLIAAADSKRCYNVARGGDGGLTMTQAQLDAQYALPPNTYDMFRCLFNEHRTILEIAQHFSVSQNAVTRCAQRLGLSFSKRRRRLRNIKIPVKRSVANGKCSRVKVKRSRAKYTPQERAERRAQANRARGLPVTTQNEVLRLYHEEHLTAQEVAQRLHVSKNSVRATVNRAYARLTSEEREHVKHAHGSAVRTGARNSNAKSKFPVYKKLET